jgi:hypothetical protein
MHRVRDANVEKRKNQGPSVLLLQAGRLVPTSWFVGFIGVHRRSSAANIRLCFSRWTGGKAYPAADERRLSTPVENSPLCRSKIPQPPAGGGLQNRLAGAR